MIATYPRVRPYLLDEAGMLPSFMRVLINDARPDPDATLATVLHNEDRVSLLVAVAGGEIMYEIAAHDEYRRLPDARSTKSPERVPATSDLSVADLGSNSLQC